MSAEHDDAGDGRWMSYAEAGQVLGIAAASVKIRARRAGWRRTDGNDGRTRVLVPAGVLAAVGTPQNAPRLALSAVAGAQATLPRENGPDALSGALEALATVMATLAQQRADEAAAHRAKVERLQVRHLADMAGVRAEVAGLADRLREARAERDAAVAQAERLKAEAAAAERLEAEVAAARDQALRLEAEAAAAEAKFAQMKAEHNATLSQLYAEAATLRAGLKLAEARVAAEAEILTDQLRAGRRKWWERLFRA